MWRSAEKNLDKFELYVLKNIFAIPDDLELVCAPVRLLLLSQARGASSPSWHFRQTKLQLKQTDLRNKTIISYE